MKIKLISPSEQRKTNVFSSEMFKIQRLNFPLLAALTPPEHDVTIVDESFAPDNVDDDVDLVGITVMTDLARRAYQVADSYRQRGVRMVLGGIHPTVVPNEALHHADAVAVGEGEDVWGQIVADTARDQLQKIYRAAKPANLAGRPLPRRDLYPRLSYKSFTPVATGIETSRGCPYDCEFCSVKLIGNQYRSRPIAEVIDEIASLEKPDLFFVDDNMAMNRNAAKELFTEMAHVKCRWVGEGTVTLAEDIDLVRKIKRSGCEALLLGFESVQKDVQATMAKTRKLKVDYAEAIRRFHSEGIAILGAFVFGFDHETKDVFDQTFEFAITNRVDLAQLRCLTPYPGTRLYQRLFEEGRLLVPNWWLTDITQGSLLYRLKSMTPDEFIGGLERISKEFYSLGSIVQRFFGVLPWKRSPLGWQLFTAANFAYRRRSINCNLAAVRAAQELYSVHPACAHESRKELQNSKVAAGNEWLK
jgi:radical SAM superfamily enzyme YgiQ (UPF0313 family)